MNNQETNEVLSAWKRDRAPVLGVTAALTAADADAPRAKSRTPRGRARRGGQGRKGRG